MAAKKRPKEHSVTYVSSAAAYFGYPMTPKLEYENIERERQHRGSFLDFSHRKSRL